MGYLIRTKRLRRVFSPFLCEINIFLRQDGQDLVQDLVWVGLTGQSNVVLRLGENTDRKRTMYTSFDTEWVWRFHLHTLILRGPSRRARLLLGVSMVIILSRPLSREPNTFPALFFFPLSDVTAMSNERDLEKKTGTLMTCHFIKLFLPKAGGKMKMYYHKYQLLTVVESL